MRTTQFVSCLSCAGALLFGGSFCKGAVMEVHLESQVRPDGVMDWSTLPYLGFVRLPFTEPITGLPSNQATLTKSLGTIISHVDAGPAANQLNSDFAIGTPLL